MLYPSWYPGVQTEVKEIFIISMLAKVWFSLYSECSVYAGFYGSPVVDLFPPYYSACKKVNAGWIGRLPTSLTRRGPKQRNLPLVFFFFSSCRIKILPRDGLRRKDFWSINMNRIWIFLWYYIWNKRAEMPKGSGRKTSEGFYVLLFRSFKPTHAERFQRHQGLIKNSTHTHSLSLSHSHTYTRTIKYRKRGKIKSNVWSWWLNKTRMNFKWNRSEKSKSYWFVLN